MSSNLWRGSLVALSLVLVSTSAFGQGQLYVEVGTLASVARGSVAFEGT